MASESGVGMMKALKVGCIAAFLTLPLSLPSQAASSAGFAAEYDFFVGGFRIAEVSLNARADSSGYEARSNVVTRGVLEVLLRGRSASQVNGMRGAFGQLVPVAYTTRYNSRTGEQNTRIAYENSNPAKVVLEPAPDDPSTHAKPSERNGSLDPLSAAVAALVPTKPQDLCNRSIPVFDGKRRFDIIFLPPDPKRFDESAPAPQWNKPLIRCLGVYERISGFADGTSKDQKYFPFDVWFEDSGNGVFRAVRLAGSTKLGFAIGNLRP